MAPLVLLLVVLSSGCQRAPGLAITLTPILKEGQPARLAVSMQVDRAPVDGLDLRGFSTAEVLKVADAQASGPDGKPLPVELRVSATPFNDRTLDIPHLILPGPLPSTLVIRYTVQPGTREGDAHMGFTGRCHGYLGKEFGFAVGRDLFLLPEPADSLRDVVVRFDLPAGWQPVTPWSADGGGYRTGVGGRLAAEHLVAAAIGLGRFHERHFDLEGTRYRLAFAADTPPDQEEQAAARLEQVARYVRGLFRRDLGPEYTVVAAPRSPTGDDIAGEGWGTGQGGTLAPLTAERLHTFALSLLEAYVRHAPYRSEITTPSEFWIVDGVKQLYAWRAVAATGLVPGEEVTRSLAVDYLMSMGVHGVDADLEKIYDTPGSHRIETETRAPFVLAYLDNELRAAPGGRDGLDRLLPGVFAGSRAASFWSAVPEIRPNFRADFRTRYVQGKEMIPLGRTYALTPTRPAPDPPAGPVTSRLTVLFTGDTQGYLENCGCKVNQSGGVARRSTAVAALRKQDPEALLLDAGSAFVRPEKQHDLDFLTREEQSLYLGTLDRMRYQAAAIGTTELTFGLDYFQSQTKGLRTPFLAANVSRQGHPIAPASLVVRAHGLRVGVLGIFEPPYGRSSTPLFEENTQGLTFDDPIETLRREVPALRKSADLILVLGRLTPHTIRSAAEVPGLDAIISSEYRAPAMIDGKEDHLHPEDQPGFVGRTLVAYSNLTNYGFSGVRLGLDAGGRIATAEFDDHWLYEDTPDDPAIRQTLNRFYDRIGREAESQGAVAPLFADDPSRRQGVYVGAARCAECHASEMAQWRRTKHATAYKTLLDRHRHFQPRCVVCHVVGYGTPHGYRLGSPELVLANVQCEVCHGPGAAHAAAPSAANIRKEVPERVCLECHTPDHSDHFVYEARLPKVKHDYFDP